MLARRLAWRAIPILAATLAAPWAGDPIGYEPDFSEDQP
jgi:hypothetical protein